MLKNQTNSTAATTIPTQHCIDDTIKLLCEGYLYIPNRMRKYNTNLFKTRLLCQKVTCISGEQAAKLFYDKNLFTRKGVIPKRIQETLFGKRGIQTLVGAEHLDRKKLFMSLLGPGKFHELVQLTKKQWEMAGPHYVKQNQILLFDEASFLMFYVACKWSGVPITKTKAKQRAKDMSTMIDAFGAVGPRHILGRCARNRSELWAMQLIDKVRSGKLLPPKSSPLYIIAMHKDTSGNLLSSKVAGVELLNILRPITAIATYITFGALSLHMYPKLKEKLKQADEEYLTMFSQEVRRFYPFGPFLGAKVRVNFAWNNHQFHKGDLVFLDIYGTNHDLKSWKNATIFSPENFRNHKENPYDFIPQGGGDHMSGTRCPGEWITIELLKVSLEYLAKNLEYDVPLQDLTYSLRRIPTLPKSKFLMTNVRIVANSPNLP